MNDLEFSGHIIIYHAFDVGDDINLEKVEKMRSINAVPLHLPKYFKNYNMPLSIELPHPHESARCISTQLHNFGAISLGYKIPFKDTLENLRLEFRDIHYHYQEQSVIDVRSVYKKIEKHITKPRFFQTRSCYLILQIDPMPDKISLDELKAKYGNLITTTLRFETETLSKYQQEEVLDDAIGYFRGDLVIVDTDASFVYDDEYKEILDFFEFANLQQLELKYFDKLLDQKLNQLYEGEGRKLPMRAYLPFIGSRASDPISGLSKLRVDISVITERLEGSIKLAGEPYFSEIYELLVEKLDLDNWKNGIDRKLGIIRDVQSVYKHNVDVNREDMLTVLIIILIFIELVIGILHYFKG